MALRQAWNHVVCLVVFGLQLRLNGGLVSSGQRNWVQRRICLASRFGLASIIHAPEWAE